MMPNEQWNEVLARIDELSRRVNDLAVRAAALEREAARRAQCPEDGSGEAWEPIRDAT